jgi:hypothetical protein
MMQIHRRLFGEVRNHYAKSLQQLYIDLPIDLLGKDSQKMRENIFLAEETASWLFETANRVVENDNLAIAEL